MELLVVVAIISVLMGILMGALSQARESARTVVCLSNLKQMQLGWQMFIQQGDGKIPDTRHHATGFDWRKAMNSIYDRAPNIFINGDSSFGACPSLQKSYPDIAYTDGRWGYAVNTWWDGSQPDPACYNDQKLWSDIRHPASYPWFIDPQVYPITGGGHVAPSRVPFNGIGAPDWGIGANHGGGNITNASLADGSVHSVAIREVRDNLAGPDSYRWLENR